MTVDYVCYYCVLCQLMCCSYIAVRVACDVACEVDCASFAAASHALNAVILNEALSEKMLSFVYHPL